MTKKYPLSRRNKIREHFREHPYYNLCKTVFGVFQDLCPIMVMTPEQLFEDASLTLDKFLLTGDLSEELCHDMWTDNYRLYRERDGASVSEDGTKAEVAMLFYMVMFGLTTVYHSHYQGTLQRTLHASIRRFYGKENCKTIEQKLRESVNQHAAEMRAWMEKYFVNTDSLTNEIQNLVNTNKKIGSNSSGKKKEITNYTLSYNCPDEMLRAKRIDAVRRMMQGWKWIEEPASVDDFYFFFNGNHRYCNLKWIGKPQAILTELIKQLINQSYIEKVTGVSARSIVLSQFGLKPSGNKERIDTKNENRIKWIIDILNYNKPFPELNNMDNEDYDSIFLSTMQAVFSHDMHITKDLRRPDK